MLLRSLLARVDRFVDGISMYRLVLYQLIALLAAAVILSLLGRIGYDPMAIALSALYLVVVCWVSNKVFARVFDVPASADSSYITALILALIITPVSSMQNALYLTAAGGLAIASKYLITARQKHILNPAAIAVLLLSLGAEETASWWVGNVWLLPLVIVGGFLIVRKLRRTEMVLTFLATAFVATVTVNALAGNDVVASVRNLALHSSLFFLGTIMLTEPLTLPPTRTSRSWYAVLIGALFPPQVHIFSLYMTPEFALVLGNTFSYLVSPKTRLLPVLREKLSLTPRIVDFVFESSQAFPYRAGQYVEVTLGVPHNDSRGNRRYLTLASSPTEDNLRFGVKFYEHGSSFKRILAGLDDNEPVSISPPAGDFTLPYDTKDKLAFIAIGIGVTPFRSMVKYLLDRDEHRDVALIYSETKPTDFVYTDIFEAARRRLGLKTIYTAQQAGTSWHGERGYITDDMVTRRVPDYAERLFYISGPQPSVVAISDELRRLGVPRRRIKTDYFSGYS